MKLSLFFFFLISSSVWAKASTFVPENGHYAYTLGAISQLFRDQGLFYLGLKSNTPGGLYKHDPRRNEFQIKDWFLQDWYRLQDLWSFDPEAFIHAHQARTFNEAKIKQFKKYAFDKNEFFHYKTYSMKEWGGLTHPPLKNLTLPLEKYDSRFRSLDFSKIQSPFFDPALHLAVDRESHSELSFGNKVIALPDKFAFEKKKELIRKARESILMSSLVFVCDPSTESLVNLLIQKHREGVVVKILVDGMISKALFHTRCLNLMSEAGISVLRSNDFFRHKLKAIYHTKTLIVDLKEAVAGGQNMIDADNTSLGVDFKNRDIDLYVSGPMVTDMAKQFVENWRYQASLRKGVHPLLEFEHTISDQLKYQRARKVRGASEYSRVLSSSETRMKGVCRFIKQAPYQDGFAIGKVYLLLLDKLQTSLFIQDPVVVDTFTKSLKDIPLSDKFDSFEMFNQLHLKVLGLARRGKSVDYITTNINMAGNENVAIMNQRIKEQLEEGRNLRANWSLAKLYASNSYYGKPHYKNLLTDWVPIPSVKVWTHMSFLHSKVFYFDRILASVGSYNFNHNATDQAYESTVICLDEELNRGLDRILVEDMANSIPLTFSSLR